MLLLQDMTEAHRAALAKADEAAADAERRCREAKEQLQRTVEAAAGRLSSITAGPATPPGAQSELQPPVSLASITGTRSIYCRIYFSKSDQNEQRTASEIPRIAAHLQR